MVGWTSLLHLHVQVNMWRCHLLKRLFCPLLLDFEVLSCHIVLGSRRFSRGMEYLYLSISFHEDPS